jgi:hypothetical protein
MTARKAAKKPTSKKPTYKKPPTGIHPIYSLPIYDAIDVGNISEMRKMATQAKKHIRDVESALASLEKKLK